jgi:radical SAM protein with 4Fe4S-binding SPASM domain
MFELADSLDIPLQFDPEVTPKDDGDLSPLEISPSKEGIERMVRLSMQRSHAAVSDDRIPITFRPDNRPSHNPDKNKQKVCGAGSTNLTIDPFGNVFPCVQLRRKVGNIHDQSVHEIWHESSGLKDVRKLAERALEVAVAGGLKQFCMGVNELRTGDALKSPKSKLEIDRIYQRTRRTG